MGRHPLAHPWPHLRPCADGRRRPQSYARAVGSDGPLCVLTFRSSFAAFDPDAFTRPPFFRPRWFSDIAGLVLDGDTDWPEVAALVTGSWRALVPKRLAAQPDSSGARRS